MGEQLTPQELLKQVNQAIVNITVGGQSYQIGSRKLTRADLKTLYDIKNDLSSHRWSEGRRGF